MDKKLAIKTLLTLDGKGIKAKQQALDYLILEAKRQAIIKIKETFDQDAFYSENAESGRIAAQIDKYLESHKDNI